MIEKGRKRKYYCSSIVPLGEIVLEIGEGFRHVAVRHAQVCLELCWSRVMEQGKIQREEKMERDSQSYSSWLVGMMHGE